MVFPSLEEFSTVHCDPCSQRLWRSQLSRSRCFSGTLFFFNDPVDVGNLISGCFAFSKSSLNIWNFTVHILLKPGLENFEHYFASVWDKGNCVVVWTFFGIAFLWDWDENWPFPVLWPLLKATWNYPAYKIWNYPAYKATFHSHTHPLWWPTLCLNLNLLLSQSG